MEEEANRIAALVKPHTRMEAIIESRAKEYAEVTDGYTGLLVK